VVRGGGAPIHHQQGAGPGVGFLRRQGRQQGSPLVVQGHTAKWIHHPQLLAANQGSHEPGEGCGVRRREAVSGQQHIQGRQPSRIRGGGDDGLAAGHLRHAPGQGIGPAKMAGHQADEESSVLIRHHHCRVHVLGDQQRRHGAYHDACGTQADVPGVGWPGPGEGIREPGEPEQAESLALMSRATGGVGDVVVQVQIRIQDTGQRPAQGGAPGGQRPDGQPAQSVTCRAACRVLAKSSAVWAKLTMAHSKPEGAR